MSMEEENVYNQKNPPSFLKWNVGLDAVYAQEYAYVCVDTGKVPESQHMLLLQPLQNAKAI